MQALIIFVTMGFWLGSAFVPAFAQPKTGDSVFQTDFEETNVLRVWAAERNPNFRIVAGFKSAQSLQVEATKPGQASVRLSLPVDQIRGARLRCRAMVKADGVTSPPNPWNGLKFMLHLTGPSGQQWLQQNNVFGTFDWKPLQFQANVASDVQSAEIILGLEAVTGRAQFDDIDIRIARQPRLRPAVPPTGTPYTGHDQPRLRGAMIGTHLRESDLVAFGQEWGANHVRWQLTWAGFPHSPADNGDLVAYDAWLEGELKRLDSLLPVCERVGLKVLIDLHTPPGGRNPASECRLFHEKRFQDKFLEWWRKMALRYRGQKTVWGYDLVNEPLEGNVAPDCLNWQQLATAAAKVMRQNDSDHAIIIEPEPWGGPESLANLEPVPVPGVVYSVHMYLPHKFTHQGVYEKAVGLRYPGSIDGRHWDKDQLRHALQPVIDWQRDYGVHIYIGEFSAIRWAPDDSAYRYLRDCIDLFEENGWDWAYHAFREWSGWSVEHGSDKSDVSPSKTRTNREGLLREWFAKNKK